MLVQFSSFCGVLWCFILAPFFLHVCLSTWKDSSSFSVRFPILIMLPLFLLNFFFTFYIWCKGCLPSWSQIIYCPMDNDFAYQWCITAEVKHSGSSHSHWDLRSLVLNFISFYFHSSHSSNFFCLLAHLQEVWSNSDDMLAVWSLFEGNFLRFVGISVILLFIQIPRLRKASSLICYLCWNASNAFGSFF